MKDVFKMAGYAFFIMAVISVVSLFLATTAFDESVWLWVRILMTTLLLVAALYLALYCGMTRGRKDRMFEASRMRQYEERGVEPTKEERERFFYRWKGFVGAFIAASPWIILSIIALFVSAPGSIVWVDTVLRIMLGHFFGYFGIFDTFMESISPYIYLPMALVVPTVIGLGYIYGNTLYERMMKQINDSKRKRRRRRRKKTPTPST